MRTGVHLFPSVFPFCLSATLSNIRTQSNFGRPARLESQPTALTTPQPQSSLRSVAVVTGLTVVQLALQFVLQRLFATYFGAAGEMDALRAALNLPVVISAMLSGSLGFALIPVFAERLAAAGERSANAVASQIGL